MESNSLILDQELLFNAQVEGIVHNEKMVESKLVELQGLMVIARKKSTSIGCILQAIGRQEIRQYYIDLITQRCAAGCFSLTLTSKGKYPQTHYLKAFMHLLAQLNKMIYGQSAAGKKRELRGVAVLERHTKYGNRTDPHWHCVFEIPLTWEMVSLDRLTFSSYIEKCIGSDRMYDQNGRAFFDEFYLEMNGSDEVVKIGNYITKNVSQVAESNENGFGTEFYLVENREVVRIDTMAENYWASR